MLFKNKNFLLLWSSQVLSQFAINIMNFLILVHVYETTGSSIASSLVWISYGMPVVVLGPILASVVELSDKRKMMMYANVAQALVIFVYALIYRQYFYLSYAVVALYSILDQFYVPAETASIPFFVKNKNLPRANGLFFLTTQAAVVLGFGFAGVIREFIGFSNTLFLSTAMLLAASAAVFALPKIASRKVVNIEGFDMKLKLYIKETIEGFRFILNKRDILYPMMLLVLLQVYLVVFVVNLPAIGEEILKTKSSYIGIMTVVPLGFGAMLGTYFVPKILAKKIRKSKLIMDAIMAASVSMIVAPLASSVFGFWTGRAIILLAFAVVGFSFVSIIVPAITYMQTHTPDDHMARVFGNFWFAAYLATLLPTLFSASITEILGARFMLVMMGVAMLAMYAYSKARIDYIISSLQKNP